MIKHTPAALLLFVFLTSLPGRSAVAPPPPPANTGAEQAPVVSIPGPIPAASPTEALLQRSVLRVDLRDHYPTTRDIPAGSVEVTPRDPSLWERLAAAGSYRLRLRFLQQNGQPQWSTDLPLKRGPLPFAPDRPLPVGRYELRASLLLPDGKEEPWPTDVFGNIPSVPIVVTEPRDYHIASRITDAADLQTRATLLGSPNRERFPKDDKLDSQARSVWDLQTYQGRVYVGCGDWNENRGPIDVWSFGPVPLGRAADFRKEFTVDDQSVDLFRVWEDTLYVPGIDGRPDHTFGNLYTGASGAWTKYRTLPGAIHVFDVASWRGQLYATSGTPDGAVLFRSSDGGRTWTRAAQDFGAFRFREMAPFGDALLLLPVYAKQGAYTYKDGKLDRLLVPLFPGLVGVNPQYTALRAAPFRGGVVYTLRPGAASRTRQEGMPRPLFFLKPGAPGALRVDAFRDSLVTDIVVQGDTCFVLTAEATEQPAAAPAESGFAGEILASRDLRSWTRLARFTVPAVPNALERLGNTFYVGLANRARTAADADSGSLWRIDP